MSTKTPALATTPHPLGRPGGPGLFHDKALQLPPYIQNIAHALMRERGMTKSRAIQIALGKVEDWKDGKGNVSAEVRAASAAAWAQWLAARATARAKPNKSDHANDADAVELAQPRVPTGNTGAGQWYGDPCYPTSARTREVPTVNAGNLSLTTSSNTVSKNTKTVAPGDLEARLHRKLVARGIHPKAARKMAKRAAARVIRERITGPGTPATATMSRSGGNVVELAEIHQWKHGWVPLTPFAVAIKAKMAHGSTRGHSPDLPKSLHSKAAELHSTHGKSVVHGSYGHSEIPAGHASRKAVEVKPKKVTPESKRAAERKTLSKDERAAYNKAVAAQKARYQPVAVQHHHGMAAAKEHTAAKQREADIAHYTPEQRAIYDRETSSRYRSSHHQAMRMVDVLMKERAAAQEKKSAEDAKKAKDFDDFKAGLGSMSTEELRNTAKTNSRIWPGTDDRKAKLAGAELQRRESARIAERLTAKPEQVIGGAGLHRIHGAPHQYLVKEDGKALGIVTGHSKDKRGELRPTYVDDTPTHYVATTVGRRKPGSDTSMMPKKNSEHTSLADAVGAVQTRGAKIPKESKADQASLFDVPKTGRSSKAPAMGEGELGGPIKFENGRTGTVWADAPKGGKWVIPDSRFEGEAHAIYVDKSGNVNHQISGREFQRKWLEDARRQSLPATARREQEQAAKTPAAAAKAGPSEQKAPRPSDAPKLAARSAPNERDEPVRRITVSPATAKAAKAKDAAIDKVEAARANPSHWANVSDAELVSLLRAIDFGGRGPTTSQALADVWAEIHRRGLKVPANLSSTGGNVIELAKVPARLRAKARQKAADNDTALPDGSWPIRNRAELADAIQSWGRAVASGHAATVKAWMVKRAKALGASQDVIARIQALEAA